MYLNLDLVPEDRIAAYENGKRSITYGELVQFCRLDIAGINKRSIVFLLCTNTIDSLSAYLYCVENELVPLMLNAKISDVLLRQLIETYEPAYLWMPSSMTSSYSSFDVVFEQPTYSLLASGAAPYSINDNLSLLMTTSGSTGSPKLVRYTRDNLECNAKNVAIAFGWTAAERPICDLQMNYTMGLNVMNTHLHVGATLLLTTFNIMSSEFWNYIREFKATNFTGVPFSYELMKRLHFFDMDLPELTTIALGGGRASDKTFTELASYAKKNGKRFFSTFGTTETSARLAYLPPELATKKTGCIGDAIPEGRLFLVNDDGDVIEGNAVDGELCYEGPNVTMGYAVNKDELLRGDDFQGVYRTGDMAHRDDDGMYYIIGRKSRFLKLLGYRVSLDECERIVSSAFNTECACIGTDDKMIVYVTSNDCDLNNVIRTLSAQLGIYRSLFVARYIAELPRNSSGKILYKELQG